MMRMQVTQEMYQTDQIKSQDEARLLKDVRTRVLSLYSQLSDSNLSSIFCSSSRIRCGT